MKLFVSSVFHVLFFPHEGNIVTIDQLYFTCSNSSASVGPSVPIVDNSQKETKNIGVRMYPSLMGTFNFLIPILYINSISDESSSSLRYVSFHTSYFDDTWTLPSSTACMKVIHTLEWKFHCLQSRFHIRLSWKPLQN
jgi:hypothetical protein